MSKRKTGRDNVVARFKFPGLDFFELVAGRRIFYFVPEAFDLSSQPIGFGKVFVRASCLSFFPEVAHLWWNGFFFSDKTEEEEYLF